MEGTKWEASHNAGSSAEQRGWISQADRLLLRFARLLKSVLEFRVSVLLQGVVLDPNGCQLLLLASHRQCGPAGVPGKALCCSPAHTRGTLRVYAV